MKKIFTVVLFTIAVAGMAGCSKKDGSAGSLGVAGKYVNSGRAHEVFTFKDDGTVLLSTQDGSGGTFNYITDGKNVTVKGLVPSEYHFENGNLANNMNRDILVKKP